MLESKTHQARQSQKPSSSGGIIGLKEKPKIEVFVCGQQSVESASACRGRRILIPGAAHTWVLGTEFWSSPKAARTGYH